MTPAPSEDERVYLRKMEIAQQRQAESDQISRDQAAEIERLRGALRAMARKSVTNRRWFIEASSNYYDALEVSRNLHAERREAAKAYNHTASQLLRERDEALADLDAAQAQCDELRTQVPAHVIAKVADALEYQSGQRGGDWFLHDCVNALRGRVGADGSGFDPKDCRCLVSYTGRHTFVAPDCKLAPDLPAPDEHVYLSTACQHEIHRGCRDQCKWCEARCRCSCHPWNGDLHPRDEACIHCATPARLAAADPVIDCPRGECPQ